MTILVMVGRLPTGLAREIPWPSGRYLGIIPTPPWAQSTANRGLRSPRAEHGDDFFLIPRWIEKYDLFSLRRHFQQGEDG
jgi:hypothetical protein